MALVGYVSFIVHGAFRFGGETYFSLADDAMVSMRYAFNLAHGQGLLWNPGGPPVEGYTNFLWTLWMAAVHMLPLPMSKVPLVVALSGIPLIVGTAFATRRVVQLLAPERRRAASLALVFTLFAYPLVFWTLRGMEVGLLALITTSATALTLALREDPTRRRVMLLALMLAAGILTRTDFAPAAAVLALFGVAGISSGRRRATAAVLFGAVGCTFLAHTALRLAIYHAAMPNTYALKMAGFTIGDRLPRGTATLAVTVGGFLLVPLLLAVAHLVRQRGVAFGSALIVTLVALQLLYTTYVGGDVWEWFGFADRFVTPVMPILLALTALGADGLQAAPDGRRTMVALRNLAIGGLGLGLVAAVVPYEVLQAGVLVKTAVVVGLGSCLALALACFVLAPRKSASESTPRRLIPALATVAVFASLGGVVLPQVLLADYVRWDVARARYGLEIKQDTRPEAVIAVASAGNIVYFADRSAVDLLGKSDPVVAGRPPQPTEFLPGHNKWDYDYSIRGLRPDLVADPVRINDEYADSVGRWGYVELLSPVYVRADSRSVDAEPLRSALLEWTGSCPWRGVAPCQRVTSPGSSTVP